MDIMVIIHQMIQLFIMMALGYLLLKTGIMDADLNTKLSKLILKCTLPALMLSSVLSQSGERDYSAVGMMFFISVLVYFCLPIISFLIVKLMRFPLDQQGLYMFMFSYGNVGFMGFPVISSIYGNIGVFYAAILNIVFNVSSFTLGVILINYGTAKKGEKLIDLKMLLTPGVSISVLSIIIYLLGITFPSDLVSVIDSVGNVTSPLAMILIGSTLATMNVRSVFTDLRVYPFMVVKQIVIPIMMWLILRILVHDPLMLGASTVLMLMPVANSSVMFANLYGRDEKLAAKGVFITTLFSLISVPAMLHFIA